VDSVAEMPADPKPGIPPALRGLLVLVLLFGFLVGVKLLSSGIKGLGSGFTDSLFEGASNPVVGLFAGILATVLVQSSSVSTTTIVGLVAAGTIPVETAIPMILGANIGTTITNTLVSLTQARRSEEFKRAFAAATMHDFFNLIAVAILLPIELFTGVLSKTATWLAAFFAGAEGGSFNSPVKAAVSWGTGYVKDAVHTVTEDPSGSAVLLLILGLALIFLTLSLITKNMRTLVAARIERSLNAALERSALVGITVGVVITVAVQSSSITTSILIPLVASGVLLVRSAYPITLGANVGTTITALLAAMAEGATAGLTIALVHTLFNVAAILIVYPWARTRFVPVLLAEKLAAVAGERRWLAVAYTFGVFVVLPVVGILVLS
jgi:sodium-dependent phosphate cotransporter